MMNKCRGCGEEVIWMKTPAGKKMPVDPEPVWIEIGGRGQKPFIRKDGSFVFGRKVGDAYENEDPDSNLVEAYESHFATCPVGGEFRNRQPRTRPKGLR